MNLYKLHDNPESLKHHDEAHESVPSLFWEKYKKDPAELKKREDPIAKDPKYAYMYAKDVLHGPFHKGENAIAKNSVCAYLYAKHVLKGSFPKGEDTIAKDDYYAYYYAKNVLKGPFSKGEKTILNSEYADEYKKFLDSLK
jgi:lambda repressor-like predicted transcriptional regulator